MKKIFLILIALTFFTAADPGFETGTFTPIGACKVVTTVAASTSGSNATYCTVNLTFSPGWDNGTLNQIVYNAEIVSARNGAAGQQPNVANHSGILDRDTTPANGNETLIGFNSTAAGAFNSPVNVSWSRSITATNGFNSTNCPTFSSGFCTWNANLTASVTCRNTACTANTTLFNATYNFTVFDNTAPKFFDQAQNNSNPVEGEAVKLAVRWTDVNLSGAILSTNETGTFVNHSGRYGSPIALSGNNAWSNFTWVNSSIPQGTVVGWKVYANDTFGQWNVSNTFAFKIRDTQAPRWSNVAQNSSNPAVGETVRLSANWTDNVKLDTAILSTDESGLFVNYSGAYGSQLKFTYERTITLNQSTPFANYTAKVVLNSSNFNFFATSLDGGDIRFHLNSSSPNTDRLAYWIDSWNPPLEAVLWVKIPNAGTTSFVMRYGNSSLTSESNGSALFSIFDDFNDNTKTNWVNVTGTDVFNETSQKMFINGTDFDGIGTQHALLKGLSDTNLSRWILEFKAKLVRDGDPTGFKNERVAGWVFYNGTAYLRVQPFSSNFGTPSSAPSVQTSGYSATIIQNDNAYPPAETAYRITFNGTNVEAYNGSARVLNILVTLNDSGRLGLYFEAPGSAVVQEHYWDDFRVRPFVASEPFASVGGERAFSEFTWRNASVTSGTLVNWRIYANDTSGNWNVTSIMTLSVGITPTIKGVVTDKASYKQCEPVYFKISAFDTNDNPVDSAITYTIRDTANTVRETQSVTTSGGTYSGVHNLSNPIDLGEWSIKVLSNVTRGLGSFIVGEGTNETWRSVIAFNKNKVRYTSGENITATTTVYSMEGLALGGLITAGRLNLTVDTTDVTNTATETATGVYSFSFNTSSLVGNIHRVQAVARTTTGFNVTSVRSFYVS